MKKFAIAVFHCLSFAIAVFSFVCACKLVEDVQENEKQLALLRHEFVEDWLESKAMEDAIRQEIEIDILSDADLSFIQEAEEMLRELENSTIESLSFDPVTDVYEGEIVDVDAYNIFN